MDFKKIQDQLHKDLEKQSWSVLDLKLNHQDLVDCCETVFKGNDQIFSEAKIKEGVTFQTESRIRKSQISWVEDWSAYKLTRELETLYADLVLSINNHFYLSIKSYESQFAYYKSGDFYKKHIDQYKDKSHRQLTTVLFLNESTQGGELIIYNKDHPNQIDAQIRPQAGCMVFFFSGHIYHEVLPVKQDRYSLTTWFRDDEDIFRV